MGIENLKRIAEEAAQKATARRTEKKERPNPTAWRMAWQDAMQEFYPEAVVSYTTKDANNLKQAVARGIPVGEVAALIEWAVKNWELVRRKISNTDKPIGPPVPDMRYVVYQISRIHTAYRQNRDAATLDLSKRRQSVQPAASEPPASPAPKLPARTALAHKPATTPRKPLPKRPPPSPQQTDAVRERYGLPRFEDIRKSR
jgi:hypothetical protein